MLSKNATLYFLLAVITVLVIIIFWLIKKYQKNTLVSGKISSDGIVQAKLMSAIYKDFTDKSSFVGYLASYLSNSLGIHSSLIIPLRYYAVSENGYFLVLIDGKKLWLDPGNNFSYTVTAKTSKATKASKGSTTTAASQSKTNSSTSKTSAANKKTSTSPEDGLTGK